MQPAPQAAAAPKPPNMGDMRHHIYVMEGALARAVDYGAKQLNREILAVMPGVFMLEGEARARGVHLDGYGVFFDVRVPMMRQSMMWSLRMMLDQDDAADAGRDQRAPQVAAGRHRSGHARVARAGVEAARESDPPARCRAHRQHGRARRRDARHRRPPVGAGVAAGMSAARPAPRRRAARDSLWAKDPNRAYTEAVTRALVDAMIDYSAPMQIGADQWLTVAARDDEGRDSLAPQDPLEEVVTMIYRIKGSDLQEYRAGPDRPG